MKILIVRLGSLGDIIHSIPAVAAIRHAMPDAHVDWLVDARHRDLVELLPFVRQGIPVKTSDPGSVVSVIRELRRSRYDAVLDLQGLLKSAGPARASGAPRVVGFPPELLRERAARLFYKETAGHAAPHVIDKNLSILRALGIRMPQVVFPIAVTPTSVVLEARERLGIGASERFAIINPGAAWPNKRWPPVYFGEVASGLAARHQLRSIVLWGPGEQPLAESVVAASNGAAAVAPFTTIGQLFELTRAAAVMVSGDTGPLHVAGAVGTPLVGIFGPTDPDRNGPWADGDLVLSRFKSCECKYQRKCHTSRWCLLDIAPREVLAAVDRRLAGTMSHG